MTVRDQATGTPREWRGVLDLAVGDLGMAHTPLRIELSARAEGALDGLHVGGTWLAEGSTRQVTASVEMYGLRRALLDPVLAELGLAGAGSIYGLRFHLQSNLEADEAGWKGPLGLRELALQADHQPAMILEELHAELTGSEAASWNADTLDVRGLQMQVARSADHRLRVASLQPARSEVADADPLPWLRAVQGTRLVAEDCQVLWTDATTEPEVRSTCRIGGRLGNLAWQRDGGLAPLALDLELAGAGLFERLAVQGTLQPGRNGSLSLTLGGEDVALAGLDPYLAPMGMRCDLRPGSLAGTVQADWTTADDATRWNVTARELAFESGDGPCRVHLLAVRDLTAAPGTVDVQSVEIDSALVHAGRSNLGWWHVPGLAFTTARNERDGARPPLDLSIASLKLGEVQLDLSDAFAREAAWQQTVRITRAEAGPLVSPAAGEAAEWDLGSWTLSVPGYADQVRASGQVQLAADRRMRQVAWQIEADGLEQEGLQPWLQRLGLEAELGGTNLALRGETIWHGAETSAPVDFELSDVRWSGADGERLGLAKAHLSGLRAEGEAWRADRFELQDPRLAVARLGDGRWQTAGVTWRSSTDPAGWWSAAHDRFGSVQIEGAAGRWSDLSGTEPLECDWQVSGGWQSGPAGHTVHGEASFHPGLRAASLDGTWAIDEQGSRFAGDLRVAGLDRPWLQPWLPAGLTCTEDEYSSSCRGEGELHPLADAGRSLRMEFENLQLAAGDRELLAAAQVRLEAPQLGASSGNRIERFEIEDLVGSLERLEDGGLWCAGATWNPVVDAASPAASGHWLDRLEQGNWVLGRQAITVKDWAFVDRSAAGAPAMHLVGSLTNLAEIDWSSREGRERPLELEAEGRLEPAAETWRAAVALAPFASRPLARLDWNVEGLRGRALDEWFGGGAGRASAAEIQGGAFRGRLQASLPLPAGENRWATARAAGFPLELAAADVVLEPNRISPPLVRCARLDLSAPLVDPWRGAWRIDRMHFDDVDLRTRRDRDGLHVLGLTLPRTQAPRAAGESAPERTIEALRMSGLDWDHSDETFEPAAPLPVRNGELEVLRWNLGGGPWTRPVRVHFTADAGEVRAPLRSAEESGSRGGDPLLETRSAYDRLELRGRLLGGEQLDGWLQVDVSALELAPLRGLFAPMGIEVGDGLLDGRNTLRFRDGELAVDARLTIDHLVARAESEARVQRDLGLPHELRQVLQDLRDADGRLDLPLRFELNQNAAGASQLATSAKRAFAQLASTEREVARPMEAVAPRLGDARYTVSFGPGSAQLDPAARAALLDWARQTKLAAGEPWELRAGLGSGDSDRTGALTSPPAEPLMELLRNLRLRKAALARKQVDAAALAQSTLLYGTEAEARAAREALRAVELARGETEEAINHVLDLLAPGAERGASRRAHTAEARLAQDRTQAVRDCLEQAGFDTSRWVVRPLADDAPVEAGGGSIRLWR
ncbi:MAG: hypothetical protein R3F17_00180 [Planctomycetota bacterium]